MTSFRYCYPEGCTWYEIPQRALIDIWCSNGSARGNFDHSQLRGKYIVVIYGKLSHYRSLDPDPSGGKNEEQRNAGMGGRNVELKILNTDAMMSFRKRIDIYQPLELGNLELVAKRLLRMSLAFNSHKLMFWTIWCHGRGQSVYMVTSWV